MTTMRINLLKELNFFLRYVGWNKEDIHVHIF